MRCCSGLARDGSGAPCEPWLRCHLPRRLARPRLVLGPRRGSGALADDRATTLAEAGLRAAKVGSQRRDTSPAGELLSIERLAVLVEVKMVMVDVDMQLALGRAVCTRRQRRRL